MTEYLAVDGTMTAYEVAGSGPPLIVGALPCGRGRLTMIEGAGHSPHEFPGQVVSLMLSCLQPDAARA
jgi:hypothetical protein